MSSLDEEISKKQIYNQNKLMKRIRHATGKAIADYKMIDDGDRIMVCMSGGKDSYVLLDVLQSLRRSAPVDFELIPVHLEANFPNYPKGVVEDYLKSTGLEYHIIKENIYDLILKKIPDGKNICSLCSRLRRGILYRFAKELKINKIALGHHADDILETFFLNLFYAGKLKAMPPKLFTDDGANIVIRPLAYCREKDMIKLSSMKNYPILPKSMCSLGENKMRGEIKEMIKQWDKKYHGRSEIMFKALKDISLSHLLDISKL
ncbi:MAG: tRNA 2-thiocytidine(32) synthetase TtcA [Succinivibrionaceae bacterium]